MNCVPALDPSILATSDSLQNPHGQQHKFLKIKPMQLEPLLRNKFAKSPKFLTPINPKSRSLKRNTMHVYDTSQNAKFKG